MIHHLNRLSFCMACVVTVALTNVTAAASVRTVALTGQQAPSSGVATFSGFHLPLLDNAGRTAFFAEASGQGIWSEGSGSLDLVARAGMQPPGTPAGVRYWSFLGPTPKVRYENGHTAFLAFLTGAVNSTNSHGIWAERSGTLELVARAGSHAPGTPSGVNFENFNSSDESLRFNAAGQTAFHATLIGSGVTSFNKEGIWSEGSGALAMVAREGQSAPGTPTGVVFSNFEQAELNDAGQTAFHANLSGPGVTAANGEGIWADRSGTLALVARTGTAAPGMPSGTFFTDLGFPVLNASGQTAFNATLHLSTNQSERAIWSEGSGSLAPIAVGGSPAAGTPNGAVFNLFSPVVLNSAGQTAFAASLRGNGVDPSNNTGIWSQGSGVLELVAREGSHAPGTPSGVNFAMFPQPALNAIGQTAFFATVSGPDVSEANDRGIWATSITGRLKLIAREGDMLEVAPSDSRTIATLLFYPNTGNGDGRPSGFNDAGQLAFLATFTDGSSGVFVSNIATIPEPATLVCASIAIIGLIVFARPSR